MFYTLGILDGRSPNFYSIYYFHIGVVIFQFALECQCDKRRRGKPIFTVSSHNWLSIAEVKSVQRSQSECQCDRLHQDVYTNSENLARARPKKTRKADVSYVNWIGGGLVQYDMSDSYNLMYHVYPILLISLCCQINLI